MTAPENENPQPVDEERESTEGRSFRIEGNDTSGYVGVDPEYRNYANETDKPIIGDEQREVMDALGILTDDEAVEQNKGNWSPPSGEAAPEQTVVAEGDGSTEGQGPEDDNPKQDDGLLTPKL